MVKGHEPMWFLQKRIKKIKAFLSVSAREKKIRKIIVVKRGPEFCFIYQLCHLDLRISNEFFETPVAL